MGIFASILRPTTSAQDVRKEGVRPNISDEPFRFLDLPPELRCMVYKELEIGGRRHILTNIEPSWCSCWKPTDDETNAEISLVRPYLPVAILRTCRLINQEATPLLARKLRELEKVPIQFFCAYGGAHCITQGRLLACFGAPKKPLRNDDSKQTKDFMARCSTFLAHTRHLPRNAKSKFDVDSVITSDNRRKQGTEFISAITGTHDRADKSRLAISFKLRDAYPELTRELPTNRGRCTQYASGVQVFRHLAREMRQHVASVRVPPAVVFFMMVGGDYWDSVLKKMEEDTRESENRYYVTDGKSEQVSRWPSALG